MPKKDNDTLKKHKKTKKEEKDEFNKLYSLLSNLATKNNPIPIIPTPIPPINILPKKNKKRDTLYNGNKILVIEEIPDKHEFIITEKLYIDDIPIKKENIQCNTCMKLFTSDESIKHHYERSTVCKLNPMPPLIGVDIPIHRLVIEWLEKAVTGDKELECKFCKTIFINKGNHHKHYYTAIACNRMATNEFKKIVAI